MVCPAAGPGGGARGGAGALVGSEGDSEVLEASSSSAASAVHAGMASLRAPCTQVEEVVILVRHLFSVPGSDAGLERVFSHAGRAITTRRSNLDPKRAAAIIFMHENDLVDRAPWCTRP